MHQAKVVALDSPDELKRKVASEQLPNPTMEDAFIRIIESAGHVERDAA
jgi:ABC-2 type transport system ATP-binding protein